MSPEIALTLEAIIVPAFVLGAALPVAFWVISRFRPRKGY